MIILCLGEATSAFFAEHKDVFVSKNTLQLKIREVRQKMMGIQNNADPGMLDMQGDKPSPQPCSPAAQHNRLPPSTSE